ncbi:hypothetical protein HHK36_001014 [Tetracentron sinense]|uniref:NAD-dependent epimerase/dehydratase domain-containing protein n=1 Tax=Tetracentron sinense TaxID=13715 RepID=A0A834ZWI5_TETSI|nr:hypothetical protein HHK36_001014 [Tetracentron sinense]
MRMQGEKSSVCVTGGTGYVASWLVMKLLQHGYSVRATVRFDSECKKDISYLTSLPGAPEKLEIINADLNNPDSFNVAIDGCVGVFHVAHPMDFTSKESETVNKAAVEGTLGILKACVNSKTVKRVVYTSSAVAVMLNNKGSEVLDESSWTDIDYCRALKLRGNSYTISKTLTEKAALEFAEEHGLDLVTLNPSQVAGPFICPGLPSTVYIALALILGNQDQYRYLYKTHMVHIDDVADAHIFLLQCPSAKGRYICSSVEITILEMAEFLSSRYPEFQIPTTELLSEIKGYKLPSLSSKKLLDLGFEFKCSIHEIFDGAIQCCKEKGFL